MPMCPAGGRKQSCYRNGRRDTEGLSDRGYDHVTGLMTALMRFQPGAVLPDHEHVNIEQTYVKTAAQRPRPRPVE
jgi:hypothetical protein